MTKEKYMSKLSRSEASAGSELHTSMVHLENNIYKHDILCPRCKKELYVEEYLFGRSEKLKNLYIKLNILEYEKVFSNSITIERLKLIEKLTEELNLY